MHQKPRKETGDRICHGRQNIEIYWINNVYMAADILTKINSDVKPFFDLMETGKYQIKVCKTSGAKEKVSDRNHQAGLISGISVGPLMIKSYR